jgi:hypothetical protein
VTSQVVVLGVPGTVRPDRYQPIVQQPVERGHVSRELSSL